MANVNNPFGFRPIRRAGASYNSGGGNVYAVPVTVAVQLAPGDLVAVDGSADANGIPSVGPAVADAPLTGCMLGVTNSPTPGLGINGGTVTFDSTLNTVASSPDIQYILVEDDPQVTYAAQASTALVVTDISANAQVVPTAPTQDGKSNMEIGAIDAVVGSPLKILRLQQIEGNEVGQFGVFEVLINNSTQANNTAGV